MGDDDREEGGREEEEKEDNPCFLPAPGDEGLLLALLLLLLFFLLALVVVVVFGGGVLGVVVFVVVVVLLFAVAVAGRRMGDRIDLALRCRRCEETGDAGGEAVACRSSDIEFGDIDEDDNDNRRRLECGSNCGERRLDTDWFVTDE